MKNVYAIMTVLVLAAAMTGNATAGAFIFAGEANGVNIITHPIGYSGTGGTVTVTVGIDNTSVNSASMPTSVQNVCYVWNNLVATTSNLDPSGISGSDVDFESVLLHEMGHSIGLAHCNIASESGLTGAQTNHTKSTDGADNVYTTTTLGGTYGIPGASDVTGRGDDVNLHWFRIDSGNENDPVSTSLPGTIDTTTYSRDTGDLPGGDTWVANADRTVSNDEFGESNTEAVMQQGTVFGETQRTLGADDVATLQLAMAGSDETDGNSDDYTITLSYIGVVAPGTADIMIDFDNAQTGFAVSSSGASFIAADHVAITSNNIYFNDGYNWHFNSTLVPVELSGYSID